jgi:hypothetical protein
MKLRKMFSIVALLLIASMAGCKKNDSGLHPVKSSTDPLQNVTGVPRNQAIAFTFSEAMNPLTINSTTFTLARGTTSVPGTVTYSGTTATFTPTDVLDASTLYTATMSTGAKTLTGNSLASNSVWSFTTGGTSSALNAVNLGTAGNYVILAKTGVSTTGVTLVTGDIGISPAAATFITGFGLILPAGGAFSSSALVVGNVYAPTYASPTPSNLTTAVSNMEAAYTDAAGRSLPDFTEIYSGDVTSKTLTHGLYKWGTGVQISAAGVTLSGSATDVWIFQIGQGLTVADGAIITLSGGALAKNIFWQVAGGVTLGKTSQFKGILLSMTSITFKTGASINGRALAQTAVVLDANAITKPQ